MANAKIESKICGAIHDESQWAQIIEALSDCKYYAYIFHDHDDGKQKHLHFCAQDRHNIRVWSKLLGIPENMIEIARSFRSCNRYLIHLDDKDKFQYDRGDVVTNKPLLFSSYLEDNQELKPDDLFHDLQKLKRKIITQEDFVEKYKFFIHKQSFLSQYKILTDLINNYD